MIANNLVKPFQKKLIILRQKINNLHISLSSYVGISLSKNGFEICKHGGKIVKFYWQYKNKEKEIEQVIEAIRGFSKNNKLRFVAGCIREAEPQLKMSGRLSSRLWLNEDIFPVLMNNHSVAAALTSSHLANIAASYFDADHIPVVDIGRGNEVVVRPILQLEDYRVLMSKREYLLVKQLARLFKGNKMLFISATPRGGGVAIMRRSLIELYHLLGVDAHWCVLEPNQEAFDVTKFKFHNILQAVSNGKIVLKEKDKKVYDSWIKSNFIIMADAIKSANIIIIDDPQPSGLVPLIKKINSQCKIIYRSHIQIEARLVETMGSPQEKTWNFIWNNIKAVDCFVSHPVSAFVPKDVPRSKLVYLGASTDPLDGLNKLLSPRQVDYYLSAFNRLLLNDGQTVLDLKRPYIIQIARFDPSKGIPDVLESYRLLCEKLAIVKMTPPQLIITGIGSVDDPDGLPILNFTQQLLDSEKYRKIRQDIKVLRLPYCEQILNALLGSCLIALQLSTKEGFEIKVTEALMKGKPVVVYKSGGIPLQVSDGEDGFIIPTGDVSQVAEKLFQLCTNQKLYLKMTSKAKRLYDRRCLITFTAVAWLFLGLKLLDDEPFIPNGTHVSELIASSNS